MSPLLQGLWQFKINLEFMVFYVEVYWKSIVKGLWEFETPPVISLRLSSLVIKRVSWQLSWGGEEGAKALIWEIRSADFLLLTFHAVFERGQCRFWPSLWTKFSSLHPDLPNWALRKQFYFPFPAGTEQMEMTLRQPTSWSRYRLLQKHLNDVKHDVIKKAETAIALHSFWGFPWCDGVNALN